MATRNHCLGLAQSLSFFFSIPNNPLSHFNSFHLLLIIRRIHHSPTVHQRCSMYNIRLVFLSSTSVYRYTQKVSLTTKLFQLQDYIKENILLNILLHLAIAPVQKDKYSTRMEMVILGPNRKHEAAAQNTKPPLLGVRKGRTEDTQKMRKNQQS